MRSHSRSVFPVALAALVLGFVSAPAPAHSACGDGSVDGSEQCDGADLGGQTCTDVTSGFAQGGTLACNPDCTFETSDCRRAFIAGLIPSTAGPRQNRCHLEWGTVGTTVAKGRKVKRLCSEGDPTCDVDEAFDNTCTFRIQVCLNVPDDRVTGCEAGRIVKFDVLQPSLSTDIGKAVASAILAAAVNAAPDQANLTDGSVSFGPPVTDFTCGSSSFRVPLKGTTGHARPASVRIRAKTSDNSGRVRSIGALTLTCNP